MLKLKLIPRCPLPSSVTHRISLTISKIVRNFSTLSVFYEKRIGNHYKKCLQIPYYTSDFLDISFSHSSFNCKSNLTIKMSPPGILHDWSLKLSPQDLLDKTDDLINECRKLCDQAGSVPDSDVSFETVLKVLGDAVRLLDTNRYFLDYSHYFAPDEGIRNASTKADCKLRDFTMEMRMRKDTFEKLLILQKKGEPLRPQAQRFLEKLIFHGKRYGLHLDDETQRQVKELNSKINSLSVVFTKNINDVTTTLEFSEQELDGLPKAFLEDLKKLDSGKFEITLKYPHYFPIMQKCKIPETRKRLEFTFNTQCLEENGLIFTKLRKLRHEAAVLLGYPSHAAYIADDLMAKNTETVNKFLTELAEKMSPLWEEEKKCLLELKEKECAELNIPFDDRLNTWDTSYYITKMTEINYAFDKTKLKEYFPLSVVKQGLFEIYQDILGLKFEQVQGEVWHEDVELYSVTDSDDGTLLGYFFLDLFPRPNKYGHAGMCKLQHTCLLPDGTRQVAVSAVLTNFTKPTENMPSLLDHDEVTTFFHEFGHLMHYICGKVEFTYFCSTPYVERDFIEAPSQMLENWCWLKEPLKKMSSHYLDNSEIPADMLDALIKSRLACVGNFNLRQIALSLFDQMVHTSPEGDTREIFYDLMRKYLGIEPQAGTHFTCHFSHLANNYDARYYGYLWSEVYSMDMFETRFGEKDVLNPVVGRDYRKKILEPGATKDAYDLLCSFLGRQPTQDAFLRSRGLKI